MSDHFLHDEKGRCHTVISFSNIYEYGGFIFEFHSFCGPVKLKKDWSPSAREGRKFYRVIDAWLQLSKAEQETTRIFG